MSQKKYSEFFIVDKKEKLEKHEIYSINNIKNTIILFFQNQHFDFDFQERKILKTKTSNPMFVPKSQNPHIPQDRILLSIEKYTYWCQVIYQLSHELTHCFIYCHNRNLNHQVKWIEETICEAMSLYFLKYFKDNWNMIDLSKMMPEYDDSIDNYLNNFLKKEGNKRLSNYKSLKELEYINNTSEVRREDRYYEMIKLFTMLTEENIKGIIYYKDYTYPNSYLLNTKKYMKDFPNNNAVKYLCQLQAGKNKECCCSSIK